MRHSLRITLSFLVCVTLARAQLLVQPANNSNVVPRLVSYSGRALEVSGEPVTGVAGITFSIYKDQAGGSPLWFETQNVTTDSNGNYTVQLGATMPAGLPLDLFTSGEARWVAVRINGGEEEPRIMLLSVPFALKAADAQTLGGLPPSAFMQTRSYPAAPTEKLAASSRGNSSAKNSDPENPAVTGVGMANFIPMWDSASDITDSILFQRLSHVGVNTASPLATLDVNGKVLVRDSLILVPKLTDDALAVNGTGFKIDSAGEVSFISGQTFPGTGTITGVTPGTALTGGGTSGTVTLSVDPAKVPFLSASNTFSGPQTFNNTAIFNGNGFFNALMQLTDAGTFTGSSYSSYVLAQIGGINNAIQFQGGSSGTDAISAGIAVPNTANRHQFDALTGLVACDAVSSPLGANNNCVGSYAQNTITRSGAAGWGGNVLVQESANLTGQGQLGFEIDNNSSGTSKPYMFNPLMLTGILSGAMTMPPAPSYLTGLCGWNAPGCAALLSMQHVLNGAAFPVGIVAENGEVSGDFIRVPALCATGGTCNSSTLAIISVNSGTPKVTQLFNDASGNFNIVPNISAPYTGGSGSGIIVNPNTRGQFQIVARGFLDLPACNSTTEGNLLPIKDANANTWGSIISAGGGTNHVLAYCDGTNWTVAAK